MGNNTGNVKWIIALAVSVLVAVGGWVFGIINTAGNVDHRLLFAQDEMLYTRETAVEKADLIQDARLNILESQVAVLQSKMDMVLDLLQEIRKAVR